uniref:PB1 domain-containing protein n=1 Tax=Kalanchoe fedtschenkoi TaxID=63787 RepID=A0A7N0T9N8_KALFE
MGKNSGKKNKPQGGVRFSSQSFKHATDESFKPDSRKLSSKSFRYVTEGSSQGDEDPDIATFVELSQELREEGNRFFQRRDHCGALLSYQKALKLLPENHSDIANLRTNMAACYMQMGVNEYPRAINECNLALQVVPHYAKALLKRARCYMDLDRFDLALMDIDSVLECEPDNIIALDLRDSLINEIVQLEAEIGDQEEAVVKKKKHRKRKKKNAKVERDTVENGEAPDQTEKDEVVVKPNDFVDAVKNEEKKIETRRVQVEEKKAERRAVLNEEKRFERKAAVEEPKAETRAVKVQVRTAVNEETKAETRALMSEEDKVLPRTTAREEVRAESRAVMKEEKKVLRRTAIREVAEAEKRAAVEIRPVVNEEKKTEMRILKLVYGEDIRRAVLPLNSSILILRDKVKKRFRSLKGVIMKYKDHEDDLITITTTEDLRMAEAYVDPVGCLRLYIKGVDYDAEPVYGDEPDDEEMGKPEMNINNEIETSVELQEKEEERSGSGEPETISESSDSEDEMGQGTGVARWIRQFARLLKNHVGFDSDSNLDLHEAGMKLYSEAMENTVASDKSHYLLENAAGTFQEMAAQASFNWGNVYMSKAKKKFTILEDDSRETVLEQAKVAFEWARQQYENARTKYELAVKIKPDFFEGFIALGYQQFEQAKLTWYYAIANDFDMESGPSSEILDLYNKAEESMEKGVMIWEEMEQKNPNAHHKKETGKYQADRMGKSGHLRTISTDEFADPPSIMRSQIYVLWGSLLYERSVVEYKMGIPVWAECLEVAVEKFELAGASQTDLAVMVKNHCSNVNALEGLEFKIDEIVRAWNEMHDAKKWQFGEPSFRLEPLFRRQGPKLHEMLEQIGYSFIQE